MKKFFYPKNIAVAGASPNENKLSNNIISNLIEMGYRGDIYPIGEKSGEIFGYPIYGSLKEIPNEIDLLVIMVLATSVPDLMRDAGEAGIDRAVIISDGFNESGKKGASLADELMAIAKRYAIRFIGPNCQGVICSNTGVCVPFAPLFRHQVKKGGISIISQSGSIAWIGTSSLSHELDGISKVASIGNKLNVDELDLLAYLIEDPETRVIVLYLESFSDGRKLCELARHSVKPIIAFKSNISDKESQIAFSHTAALASDDRIADSALAQAGILRAYTLREMIEMCKALSLPHIKGDNLAILAGSGGLALIGEDSVQREKLNLAPLPAQLLQKIGTMGTWKRRNLTNPVDLGGFFNNQDILNSIALILALDQVDGAAVSLFSTKEYNVPFSFSQFVDKIDGMSRTLSKPVALHLVSDHFPLAELKKNKGFPIFDTMEDAVHALSTQWRYHQNMKRLRSPCRNLNKEKEKAKRFLVGANGDPQYQQVLLTMEIISAYGIKCEMPVFASNLEEAYAKASEIGYPVVMKINSPDISHKSDVGGVKVDIKDEIELEKAFAEFTAQVKKSASNIRIYGVMLQKMVPKGKELILGGKNDKDFGPVVMFGMGGIFAEELKDISFRLAPICHEEACEMVEEIRGFPILKGVRGDNAVDISVLLDALERLSVLLSGFPEILELDLNPAILSNDGKELVVVDARMKTVSPIVA